MKWPLQILMTVLRSAGLLKYQLIWPFLWQHGESSSGVKISYGVTLQQLNDTNNYNKRIIYIS